MALFHFGLFPAGWVGVQIFFVLSGYLITSILLKDKDRALGAYLKRFYWRRSLRIFPLYFIFLIATAVIFVAIGYPGSFARDWPFLATYTTNFGRLRDVDIGAQSIHLWSLAVEEQFYLVWPLAVYFLPATAFKRLIVGLLLFCPLARFLMYFIFQGQDHDWIGRNIYCLPISQFDAFAAGAAIALWKLSEIKYSLRWLGAAATLTAICGAAVLAHQHIAFKSANKWSLGYEMYLLPDFGFVWGYSLLNLLSATVIIVALQSRSFLSAALEFDPLARMGTISYGVYIYHLPLLLALTLIGLPKVWLLALWVPVTLVVSEVSYRFLEMPFLLMKDSRRRQSQAAAKNVS